MSSLNQLHTLHVACSRGLESLLAEELLQLGFVSARARVGRVTGEATLENAYRAVLWSRLASRVLLQLEESSAQSAEELQEWLALVDWSEHLLPEGSLAIDVIGTTPQLRNTHNTALQAKDAIVDYFRQQRGQRPSVEKNRPDVRFQLRFEKGHKTLLNLDLGGVGLHQRGYRLQAGLAPLRETLAAGLLMRAGWPRLYAEEGAALLDPFCGSGTLLAEAAFMALDIAPGLLRPWHGLENWLGHRPKLWQDLCEEAEARRAAAASRELNLEGSDQDARVIQMARDNLERAGLLHQVRLIERPLNALPPAFAERGLLITNPPYGERLDELPKLAGVYAELGQRAVRDYPGWRLALFTNNQELAYRVPLKPYKNYPLQHASLECRLYLFEVPQQQAGSLTEASSRTDRLQGEPSVAAPMPVVLSEGAQMFANRLGKNLKKLARWVKREQIECYRVYDADMPEYALAVDIYGDQVHVQEYAPPASIDEGKAQRRLMEALQAMPSVLGVSADAIHLKQRRRQSGKQQYEKFGGQGVFFPVREGQVQLLVNLTDYLDTGLFLDHRPVRLRIGQEARATRFLNLFCYTGAATVHAAVGGAIHTTSVDLSNTYLGWLERNLKLNKVDLKRHSRVQADCREWLKQDRGAYDLIFMDPPTFSNSKRMQGTLDIQRDQVELVHLAMQRLSTDGLLIFSNNLRGFKISPELEEDFEVVDITRKTLDPDFERNSKIHQCFEIRHR
ncbi:bifunctional 23S rRNA (guanine(2069)-N(7))-methyltransferase RlmK/23S rRNA (guanine(2445)-N(2))-methyltransferase RlmL [Marinospirillum alkaliphilum]|uniref:Ribosomal RNA large subunit methyltransferase K/L n=1 Tax=Marinospirillum alkaliphilum DSM 21637 TaxID=1122209 RepID=A0A1K1TKM0_9GAMM|nr:bifunctional 23S rRNA (guanine(2069)-N(7))-methyltransferase RlmK/23S rRNA (guanine(2445)-N(2))-methyltransferase RlmL [Marinospirillum alkaliphilum]SFX00845.1 23S rRNA (guanine2445-N2)-methyltransferase / 23S rRNA (guanine2069-N7)-methyltransferase [Marinospirillum alkaliphilum DSM 21637]